MSTPQEKMQAFQSAQKFGKQYPGLIEALQDWAAIGSLEQAADEAKARLGSLRAEEEGLARALATKAGDAETTARTLREAAERDSASKHAIAAALVDEAKLESRCIVDAARTAADQRVEDAQREIAELQSLISAAKRDLAGITARTEAKAGELAAVSAAIEEKHAQHGRLAGLIAGIKAKL